MNYMDEMAEMMGMGERELGSRVAMPLCDRVVYHEISEDVVLPEDQPEIRRILSVRETVLPPARYIGGANAEWNGTADYQILYLSADGRLCTAPASAEYGLSVPLETGAGEFDLNEGVCAFVSTVSDGISTRVTGPRKLSLRHRMRSHVRAYGQMILGESVSGTAEPQSIRRLTAEGTRMIPATGSSELIEIRDECSMPMGECRIISVEPRVFVSTVSLRDGCALASGEVLLRMMLDHGSSTELQQRKIPFDGEIEGEDFFADGSACVDGTISDLRVVAEDGRISCEGELLLTGRSMSAVPLRYTEDLYSTERESACDYREYEIPVPLKCENRNISQSERIPLEEARLPEGCQILEVWGDARLETCEAVGEKYVWTGQSRYSILCQRDGDYSVAEVNLPLRYETESAGGAPVSWDGVADVISCRARADEETLYLDAELSITADYVGCERIRCVSAVRFGDLTEKKKNCMRVYYPTPEETPWSVAKKFQVSQDELEGDISTYFVF